MNRRTCRSASFHLTLEKFELVEYCLAVAGVRVSNPLSCGESVLSVTLEFRLLSGDPMTPLRNYPLYKKRICRSIRVGLVLGGAAAGLSICRAAEKLGILQQLDNWAVTKAKLFAAIAGIQTDAGGSASVGGSFLLVAVACALAGLKLARSQAVVDLIFSRLFGAFDTSTLEPVRFPRPAIAHTGDSNGPALPWFDPKVWESAGRKAAWARAQNWLNESLLISEDDARFQSTFEWAIVVGPIGAGKTRFTDELARCFARRVIFGDHRPKKFGSWHDRLHGWGAPARLRAGSYFRRVIHRPRDEDLWDGGRLSATFNGDAGLVARLKEWRPRAPTLVLLDEASQDAARLSIDIFNASREWFQYPVRLLIIHHVIPDKLEISRPRHKSGWQSGIFGFSAPPIFVGADMALTTRELRGALGRAYPAINRDDYTVGVLLAVTEGNPLLFELACEELMAGRPLDKINRSDLLRNKVRRLIKSLKEQDVGSVEELKTLAVATLIDGLGRERLSEAGFVIPDPERLRNALRYEDDRDIVQGVRPKVIGHTFVRAVIEDPRYLGSPTSLAREIVDATWRISPAKAIRALELWIGIGRDFDRGAVADDSILLAFSDGPSSSDTRIDPVDVAIAFARWVICSPEKSLEVAARSILRLNPLQAFEALQRIYVVLQEPGAYGAQAFAIVAALLDRATAVQSEEAPRQQLDISLVTALLERIRAIGIDERWILDQSIDEVPIFLMFAQSIARLRWQQETLAGQLVTVLSNSDDLRAVRTLSGEFDWSIGASRLILLGITSSWLLAAPDQDRSTERRAALAEFIRECIPYWDGKDVPPSVDMLAAAESIAADTDPADQDRCLAGCFAFVSYIASKRLDGATAERTALYLTALIDASWRGDREFELEEVTAWRMVAFANHLQHASREKTRAAAERVTHIVDARWRGDREFELAETQAWSLLARAYALQNSTLDKSQRASERVTSLIDARWRGDREFELAEVKALALIAQQKGLQYATDEARAFAEQVTKLVDAHWRGYRNFEQEEAQGWRMAAHADGSKHATDLSLAAAKRVTRQVDARWRGDRTFELIEVNAWRSVARTYADQGAALQTQEAAKRVTHIVDARRRGDREFELQEATVWRMVAHATCGNHATRDETCAAAGRVSRLVGERWRGDRAFELEEAKAWGLVAYANSLLRATAKESVAAAHRVTDLVNAHWRGDSEFEQLETRAWNCAKSWPHDGA